MLNFQNFSTIQWLWFAIGLGIILAVIIQIISIIVKKSKPQMTIEPEPKRIFLNLQGHDTDGLGNALQKILKLLADKKCLDSICNFNFQKEAESKISKINESLLHRYVPKPPLEPTQSKGKRK